MTWIEAADPPAVGSIVLVACPGRRRPLLAEYLGEERWRIKYGSRVSAKVTHWMPLPSMPYPYQRSQTSWYQRGRKHGVAH